MENILQIVFLIANISFSVAERGQAMVPKVVGETVSALKCQLSLRPDTIELEMTGQVASQGKTHLN